ncbi:hypothetical protein LJY25_04095 [Hymenobacter sp. BT175]|uniref:hypothetical protein n=1 Tax=Hymenobacter translucens TaxID=2886507 RepID=UPI001D0E31FB|nr:hypothetical protein [Hymenobacter translucens]MCC2545614.1 hypothetical protein [Hymenobacter translucens]
MTTDQNQPASIPNENDEAQAQTQSSPAKPADGQAAAPAHTTSTQGNLGDGAGIRGNYGDSSQTNGLEGGPDEQEKAPQQDEEPK